MRGRLPRPLLAAVGAATRVRRVPAALVQLPVQAIVAYENARRAYDELALRGQEVVAGLLGSEDAPAPTPVRVVSPDPVGDAVAHVEDPLEHHRPRPEVAEPLPGYDGMTLGALRGHLRTLSVPDLERVLAYERGYLGRGPMITLVEHRLAKLALEAGTQAGAE